jgi:hypothetical protein
VTAPPPWLSELQSAWSSLLRAPLDASSGTFRERREAYPDIVRAAVRTPQTEHLGASTDDRLALYHQQYWMRLFSTLQGHLPRFALAIGYWHFNHLASLHLEQSPPRHFDLERAADGLATRIQTALHDWQNTVTSRDLWTARLAASRAPRELLEQALHIDVLERRVFEAAFEPRWTPTPRELAALASLRLRVAPSLELVTETWDLVERSSLTHSNADARPPSRLPKPRHWALFRTANGITRLQLSEPCATFLDLCRQFPFGEALAQLEATATPDQLTKVRSELPQWVQLALANHWWLGVSSR